MRQSVRNAALWGIAAALLLFPFSTASAQARIDVPSADVVGASDSALVKRYEGSFIISYEAFAYSDFTVPLSPLVRADPQERDRSNNYVYRPERKIEVEGTLTRLVYLLPENRSPLEVLRNYQEDMEDAGGEVVFECRREECGGDDTRASARGGGRMTLTQFFFYETDLKDALVSAGRCALTSWLSDQRFFAGKIAQDGSDAWVTVQTYSLKSDGWCAPINGRTIAVVHVLEPRAREQRMVLVEAAEMASSLDSSGSISLYGIHFDFDRSDIRPESEPTLKEIATLLERETGLAVLVVGHTDSQGSYSYNLDLSARRAAAVKAALMARFGIDGARLTTAGAGMMAPVATNDTEEGRARNRRVVLVKAN